MHQKRKLLLHPGKTHINQQIYNIFYHAFHCVANFSLVFNFVEYLADLVTEEINLDSRMKFWVGAHCHFIKLIRPATNEKVNQLGVFQAKCWHSSFDLSNISDKNALFLLCYTGFIISLIIHRLKFEYRSHQILKSRKCKWPTLYWHW